MGKSVFFVVGFLPTLFISCGSSVEPKAKPVSVAELQKAVPSKGRPTLVNHWATWCQPCVEELPSLARLARRYSDRVDFVGISWDLLTDGGDVETVRKSVESVAREAQIPYDSFLPQGSAESLGEAMGLEDLVIPQTTIFDREGKRVAHFEAILDEKDFQAVEEALQRVLR